MSQNSGLKNRPIGMLTEMLSTLQSAQQDKADFLDALDLDDDPETDTRETDVAAEASAADSALSAHVSSLAESEVSAASAAGWTSGDSLNVLSGRLEDAQDALSTANENAADEAGLPNAIEALETAQTTYQNALEAAGDELTAVNAEIAKSEALVSGTAGIALTSTADSVDALIALDADPSAVVPVMEANLNSAGELDTTGSSASIIELGANGELVATDGVDTTTIPGFAALLDAAQTSYDAALAQDDAQSDFEAAIADVLDIETPDWNELTVDGSDTVSYGSAVSANNAFVLYTNADGELVVADQDSGSSTSTDPVYSVSEITVNSASAGAATEVTITLGSQVTGADITDSAYTAVGSSNEFTLTDDASVVGDYYTSADGEYTSGFEGASGDAPLTAAVATAQDNVETLQTLIDEREALIADKSEADQLETELSDLNEAISAAETALDDDGYVVESIDASAEAGTTDSDIFLLGDTDSVISNFDLTTDEEAGDSIYVGEQLNLVVAGEDQDISDDLGDAATLDAIVVDDGANTTVYFEEKTFAGNGSTDADTVSIELAGVTGSEVSINSDGFLTVA